MLDKHAFHSLSYGLYIISARDKDGRAVGCIANTFQQVSSEPPNASVSLNKENVTTQAILETGRFDVSVLSTDATMDLIGRFGFKNSYEIDKFEGIFCSEDSCDIPYVTQDCIDMFSVVVKETVDVSTHIMFIGEVVEAEVFGEGEPLTYSYYHTVLKGKTPPKAVSYIKEETPEPASDDACPGAGEVRYGWQCTLCGYIVEMEELPPDFVCPICGAGPELFERITL